MTAILRINRPIKITFPPTVAVPFKSSDIAEMIYILHGLLILHCNNAVPITPCQTPTNSRTKIYVSPCQSFSSSSLPHFKLQDHQSLLLVKPPHLNSLLCQIHPEIRKDKPASPVHLHKLTHRCWLSNDKLSDNDFRATFPKICYQQNHPSKTL